MFGLRRPWEVPQSITPRKRPKIARSSGGSLAHFEENLRTVSPREARLDYGYSAGLWRNRRIGTLLVIEGKPGIGRRSE